MKLSDPDNFKEFAFNFRELQFKFPRVYAKMLARAKLTLPQYALLNVLSRSKMMCMTEASRELRLTKPAITNLVDRLEKHGFLKRVPCAEDRRMHLLRISPKGEQATDRVRGQILAIMQKAFGRFKPGEQKIVSRFYAFLCETIDSEKSARP